MAACVRKRAQRLSIKGFNAECVPEEDKAQCNSSNESLAKLQKYPLVRKFTQGLYFSNSS